MKEIKNDLTFSYLLVKSDFGRLHLAASPTQLVALAFDDNWPAVRRRIERYAESQDRRLRFSKNDGNFVIDVTLQQLAEFILRKRKEFTIPLELIGTDFEKTAWRELRKIPFGKVRTYTEHAEKMKRPKARRSIAAANARNPISILIPCHRVVGKSGHLTGYAGALAVKELLLDLEASR